MDEERHRREVHDVWITEEKARDFLKEDNANPWYLRREIETVLTMMRPRNDSLEVTELIEKKRGSLEGLEIMKIIMSLTCL